MVDISRLPVSAPVFIRAINRLWNDLKTIRSAVKKKKKQLKNMQQSRTLYTENINAHVPSVWCVHGTVTDRDVTDQVKIYCIKSCEDEN